MPGGQYGGANGGQYGGSNGAQNGDMIFGSRIELAERGQIGTDEIVEPTSVSIGLEHTALSDLSAEFPAYSGLSFDRFRNGRMTYHRDGRRIFAATIDGHDVANDRTIKMDGVATEDAPLVQHESGRSYFDITIEDAIRDVVSDLPYIADVRPSPERPVSGKIVQQANSEVEFEAILTDGQDIDFAERLSWRWIETDAPVFNPPDFPDQIEDGIYSVHKTSPLTIRNGGVEQLQSCIPFEAEDGSVGGGSIASDADASGGEAVTLTSEGDSVSFNFGFDYTIPEGFGTIDIRRQRLSEGTAGRNGIEISVNGAVVDRMWADNWDTSVPSFEPLHFNSINSELSQRREAGEQPHSITIEKISGNGTVEIDVIAVMDNRYWTTVPTGSDDTVDSNGALPGPSLYSSYNFLGFDIPATGAILDSATLEVTYDNRGGSADVDPKLFLATLSDKHYTRNQYTGENAGPLTLSAQTETSRLRAGCAIGSVTDPNRTATPLEGSKSQRVEVLDLTIDGNETPLISGERSFSGTPLSILQTLHNDSGRRFMIDHGTSPADTPTFTSFESRDAEARSTANWIVTDSSEEAEVGDYRNEITVIGAPITTGSDRIARATVRDQSEIDALKDPPDDDGVRPLVIEDDELETDNDCLSKARALLRERVAADSRGGSMTIAPLLPDPGPQYRINVGNGGWSMEWGMNWSGSSYLSQLESVEFSESAGSARTTLEFERYSGLYQIIIQ